MVNLAAEEAQFLSVFVYRDAVLADPVVDGGSGGQSGWYALSWSIFIRWSGFSAVVEGAFIGFWGTCCQILFGTPYYIEYLVVLHSHDAF